jgi:hypothetical protein
MDRRTFVQVMLSAVAATVGGAAVVRRSSRLSPGQADFVNFLEGFAGEQAQAKAEDPSLVALDDDASEEFWRGIADLLDTFSHPHSECEALVQKIYDEHLERKALRLAGRIA